MIPIRPSRARARSRQGGELGSERCVNPSGPADPRALQALRPSLASMKDGDDLEVFASQPVWDHIGGARNHELARAGDSSGASKIRQSSQTLYGRQERHGRTGRCVGIVARNAGPKIGQVRDRARRPDDGHARGAFRSRVRPHERSQADTSLWAAPRPASSSLRPA